MSRGQCLVELANELYERGHRAGLEGKPAEVAPRSEDYPNDLGGSFRFIAANGSHGSWMSGWKQGTKERTQRIENATAPR
ncbi:MAG TPA: hypothetical protein VJH33_02590 [Candidatus Paceibacterota bacterium]